MTGSDQNLPLQRAYHWEKARAHHIYMTQPMPGGVTRDYSWSQAVGEARRMASWLKAQNWAPGTRIGILSKNCAWWIMSDLAIWMAGYVSVPLYPTLAATTVRQILDHSEAKACFIGKLDEWPQMRPGVPDSVLCISYPVSPDNDFATWDDIVARTAPIEGEPLRDADDLATIIYTSGTTGMPKGVMHRFRTFGLMSEVGGPLWQATENERVLSHLPLAHVAERLGVEAGSLVCGYRVYFAESLETFAQDLQRARPTRFGTVPRLWAKFQQGVHKKMPPEKLNRLLRLPVIGNLVRRKVLRGLGFDQVGIAFVGAAPMPPAMLDWYRRLGLEINEVYGMTENFAISHGTQPGTGRIGYVGTPYDGVECRLSDIGEVLVRSPGNMIGYYKEPEKTAEALGEDGFLHTGDVGEFDEQGRLRITGRAKEIFKTSKGKYVAPAPIENKLSALPVIEAVCVVGEGQGQPCALAMLAPEAIKQGREALVPMLSQHLDEVNAALDPHEQLDFLVVVKDTWNVDNGFITPTLKIKRNVVEKVYGGHLDEWYRRRQAVIWQA